MRKSVEKYGGKHNTTFTFKSDVCMLQTNKIHNYIFVVNTINYNIIYRFTKNIDLVKL